MTYTSIRTAAIVAALLGATAASASSDKAAPTAAQKAAIEASLKLDISHSGSGLPVRSPIRHFQPVEHQPLWEGACSR